LTARKKGPEKGLELKTSIAEQIIEGLREFTEALENEEVVSERFTCRKFELDIKPQSFDPEKVKETRKLLRASQTVFALFLGVSVRAVRSWEQGRQEPSPIACRFMDEIQRNPAYWRLRFRESVVAK